MAKPKEEWRHLALLVSILFLFLVTPLIAMFRHGVLILNGVAALAIVTASYALMERKRLFATAVALSGISVIATWLLYVTQQHWAALLSHSCVIVFIAFFPSPLSTTSCAAAASRWIKSLRPSVSTC